MGGEQSKIAKGAALDEAKFIYESDSESEAVGPLISEVRRSGRINRRASTFQISLSQTDSENAQSLLTSIKEHHENSANSFDLVASNSFCSKEVRKVMGSTLMNSYCIGLPGARFYGGCDKIDDIELQTREVLCDLYGAKYCEVQLLSGMLANIAAYNAMLPRNGCTVMSSPSKHGGHYSHNAGGPLTRLFGANVVQTPWNPKTYNVDLEALPLALATHKPTLLIIGWSEMLFEHDLAAIRAMCDEHGTKILYDMSHVAGLIAGGAFQKDMMKYSDIVTSSTGKSLHSADHGIVLYNDPSYTPMIREAVMPLLTSNTHFHETAALCVALLEMKEFGTAYANQVVANTQALAAELVKRQFVLLCPELGYSKSHELIVDLEGMDVVHATSILNDGGIFVNPQELPQDTAQTGATGLRLGTQVLTRRGFKEDDMADVAAAMEDILKKNTNPSQVSDMVTAKSHSIQSRISFTFDHVTLPEELTEGERRRSSILQINRGRSSSVMQVTKSPHVNAQALLVSLVEHHENSANAFDLVASNSFCSKEVRNVMGSTLMNSYCIGLPGARFYGGCKNIDKIEEKTREIVCELYGAKYCEVQLLSGMLANIAAYNAMLPRNGCTVMASPSKHGGHYSHNAGGPLTRLFGANVVQTPWNPKTYNVDLEALPLALATHKPTLLIIGWSEMLFEHDLAAIRAMCDEHGTKILYDMSHVAGLIAGGEFQKDMMKYSDIVTSSTGKSLHSADHGIVLTNDASLMPKVREAVMPLLTSNTHFHETAALCMTLLEMKAHGAAYAKQVIANSQALGAELAKHQFVLLCPELGYSKSHELIVDLEGKDAVAVTKALNKAGIFVNPQELPHDTAQTGPTGLRLGTQVLTRRGFTEANMADIAKAMADVLKQNANTSSVSKFVEEKCFEFLGNVSFAFTDVELQAHHSSETRNPLWRETVASSGTGMGMGTGLGPLIPGHLISEDMIDE